MTNMLKKYIFILLFMLQIELLSYGLGEIIKNPFDFSHLLVFVFGNAIMGLLYIAIMYKNQ